MRSLFISSSYRLMASLESMNAPGDRSSLCLGTKRPGSSRPFRVKTKARRLRFQNGHDGVAARIDDDDFIADQDEIVAAPLGVDRDHFGRQRIEVDGFRHGRAD